MSSRVRRLALVGPFRPFRGGIAQFNDRLSLELSSRNNEVHTFTFSRQYPERLFPGTSQYDSALSGNALPVIDSLNPLSWASAGRAIRASHADVSVAAYWTPHLAPALSSTLRSARIPAIGLIHNALPHGSFPFAKGLTRKFLRSLRGVVALSDSVADTTRSLGFKGRITVSPHPVYDHMGEAVDRAEARTRLDLPLDAQLLLCFGLVRPYKGFDQAVEAMDYLATTNPRAVLVIAGEAYDTALDDLLATNPALEKRVLRHSRYIPNSDVRLYFSAADLLLLPYRRATQSGPLALAAQFQLPCVATDVGGLAEQVVKYDMGEVCPPDEVRALALAIARALETERNLTLKAGAKRMAADLDWGSFAAAVEDLIDELI